MMRKIYQGDTGGASKGNLHCARQTLAQGLHDVGIDVGTHSLFTDFPQAQNSWISQCGRSRWNVTNDDTSCRDNGVLPHRDTSQQDCPGADVYPVSNDGAGPPSSTVSNRDAVAQLDSRSDDCVVINNKTNAMIKGKAGTNFSLRSQLDPDDPFRKEPIGGDKGQTDHISCGKDLHRLTPSKGKQQNTGFRVARVGQKVTTPIAPQLTKIIQESPPPNAFVS